MSFRTFCTCGAQLGFEVRTPSSLTTSLGPSEKPLEQGPSCSGKSTLRKEQDVFKQNSPCSQTLWFILFFVYLPRIAALVETGLVDYWKQIHYPKDMCSDQSARSDNQRASVAEVSGIFVILIVGLVLSTAVLVSERFALTETFHSLREAMWSFFLNNQTNFQTKQQQQSMWNGTKNTSRVWLCYVAVFGFHFVFAKGSCVTEKEWWISGFHKTNGDLFCATNGVNITLTTNYVCSWRIHLHDTLQFSEKQDTSSFYDIEKKE